MNILNNYNLIKGYSSRIIFLLLDNKLIKFINKSNFFIL